jgi:putative transposase
VPRNPRIFVPGAIYHVYCRTARGEFVFDDQQEVERWIDTVAFVSQQDRLTIFAWCLLSNHFHLVIQTDDSPLCRPMARIQGRFAKDINRRNGWTGRLWQSRYKARLVTEREYLEHLFAYVHLNPVAAGIVADPSDYGPTGHRALLGIEEPRLVNTRAALLCFDEDPVKARNIYQETVRAVAEARWLNADVRDLPWWRTVPDDDETVLRHLAPDNAELFNGEPPPTPEVRPPVDSIIETANDYLGLTPNQLSGRGRTRYESWCRCLVTTLAVGNLGYRAKDLAEHLDKSSVSVSRWLSEGMQLELVDPEFRRLLKDLRVLVGSLHDESTVNLRPGPTSTAAEPAPSDPPPRIHGQHC